MASRSVTWPPRLQGGRWALTADPSDGTADKWDRGEALRQVIRLSLLGGPGGNPWNVQAGVGLEGVAFTGKGKADLRGLRTAVRARFQQLERQRRAKFESMDVDTSEPGVVKVSIRYHDLETDGRDALEITL